MPIFCPILALIRPQVGANYDDPLAMDMIGPDQILSRIKLCGSERPKWQTVLHLLMMIKIY